eukprot:gene2147-2515_t
MLGWVNPQVLPSPVAVVQKWIEYALPLTAYDPAATSWLSWAMSGELWMDTLGSMYRVAIDGSADSDHDTHEVAARASAASGRACSMQHRPS